ncbi:MAG: hypothetical protein ACKVT0_10655 [Planctomycetaceae bacterium]
MGEFISVTCTKCGKHYRIPTATKSKAGRCKECGNTIRLPERPAGESDDDFLSALDEAVASSNKSKGVKTGDNGDEEQDAPPAPASRKSAKRKKGKKAATGGFAGAAAGFGFGILMGGGLWIMGLIILMINIWPFLFGAGVADNPDFFLTPVAQSITDFGKSGLYQVIGIVGSLLFGVIGMFGGVAFKEETESRDRADDDVVPTNEHDL